MRLLRPHASRAAGFTLAEVAVTLIIVSATLVAVLQGLNTARSTSAYYHNRKVALRLAMMTFGEFESGLYWDELDGEGGSLGGNYAEQGYEAFTWEAYVGDQDLPEYEEDGYDTFDNYAHRRYLEEDEDDFGDEDVPYAGSTGADYETLLILVRFPETRDRTNEVRLERNIPLEQIYGHNPDEPEDGGDEADS